MMGQHQTMMVKRTLLLVSVMVATLIAASGVALAINKVCPSGSTQANPCSGTTGKDLLLGTSGADYIKGLAGNDQIVGGLGDDTTDGGGGNDTYSYENGWGVDTLKDASGTDALNFSANRNGMTVRLLPEFGLNYAYEYGAGQVLLDSGTVIEKVTGTSEWDDIRTGGGPNTLQPGPDRKGASLGDYGGCTPQSYSSVCTVAVPASSDTYSGFAASGNAWVEIHEHGGSGDKLVLPFAATDIYFDAWNSDADPALDSLSIMTSAEDEILIWGQLEPQGSQKGHIEQLVFTDGTITIGSETASQTLNAEAQVEKLNDASNLDEAEKEKRKKAAKKLIEEAKKKAQDDGEAQQHSPSSPSEEKKR